LLSQLCLQSLLSLNHLSPSTVLLMLVSALPHGLTLALLAPKLAALLMVTLLATVFASAALKIWAAA